jgi:hypothetical protein
VIGFWYKGEKGERGEGEERGEKHAWLNLYSTEPIHIWCLTFVLGWERRGKEKITSNFIPR